MAEDLLENLSTYNEQLKQVEAALTNAPEDPELLKLRDDLLEVLELTNDLINAQGPKVAAVIDGADQEPVRNWKAGDKCMALWSEDSEFYLATVDEITSDGQVLVQFDAYKATEVTKLSLLREPVTEEAGGEAGAGTADGGAAGKNKRNNRDQQEYLKKKKQKKQQRYKELEEVREQEKSKWQQFNQKAKKGRGIRGYVKQSIFKTPDAVSGKVGVGTCGVGGQPMTSYAAADKWKRGT